MSNLLFTTASIGLLSLLPMNVNTVHAGEAQASVKHAPVSVSLVSSDAPSVPLLHLTVEPGGKIATESKVSEDGYVKNAHVENIDNHQRTVLEPSSVSLGYALSSLIIEPKNHDPSILSYHLVAKTLQQMTGTGEKISEHPVQYATIQVPKINVVDEFGEIILTKGAFDKDITIAKGLALHISHDTTPVSAHKD